MIRFILIHAPAGFIGGHCHVRVLVRHTRLNGDIICIQSSLEPGGLVGGFIRRLVTEVGPAIWLDLVEDGSLHNGSEATRFCPEKAKDTLSNLPPCVYAFTMSFRTRTAPTHRLLVDQRGTGVWRGSREELSCVSCYIAKVH